MYGRSSESCTKATRHGSWAVLATSYAHHGRLCLCCPFFTSTWSTPFVHMLVAGRMRVRYVVIADSQGAWAVP